MAHDPPKKPAPPQFPVLEGPNALNLGGYQRHDVTNVNSVVGKGDGANKGRAYFDLGLRLLFAYQHEEAAECFLACLSYSPNCALAHGLIALCHGPNYNFKGEAYYGSTSHPDHEFSGHYQQDSSVLSESERAALEEMMCLFPSQQVAEKHSRLAMQKIEQLKRANKKKLPEKRRQPDGTGSSHPTKPDAVSTKKSTIPSLISEVEVLILSAIRALTCHPGVDPSLADDIAGRPYANALKKVHLRYPDDPEVAYFLAESLMVLNAWSLYEYPSGKPLSKDAVEIRSVLETVLESYPEHAGLCHLYVHLCEMSSNPEKALPSCEPLRMK